MIKIIGNKEICQPMRDEEDNERRRVVETGAVERELAVYGGIPAFRVFLMSEYQLEGCRAGPRMIYPLPSCD